MNRKTLVLLAFFLAAPALAGCSFPAQYPIEDVQNILVAGLDTDGEDIVLSALVDTISPGGESGKEQIGYKLYVEKGKTVFEAKRNFHTYTDKRLSLYHTKYIVIGEEAARDGIDRLLAYFCEDNESRLLFRLVVAKGMTAKDFLQQANSEQNSLAGYLDTLFEEYSRTGKSREIHLINYVIYREMPWQSVYIPTAGIYTNPMEPTDSSGGEATGSGKQDMEKGMLVKLEGFALFDEDRLAGFLDGRGAQGLDIINNDFSSANITVTDKTGMNAALEIMKSSAKILPDFDSMSATVKVKVIANLVEYQTDEEVFDAEYIDYLEEQLDTHIKSIIDNSIKTMQEYRTDAAFIGDTFYHKDPVAWQDIKDDWKSVFAGMDINVEIDSEIQCTYEMLNAVGR